MRCPSCKNEDTFRSWKGTSVMMGVDVAVRGQRCKACGETLYDDAEVERQELEVADALVARGIVSGAEFKLVRKAAGFRATEVAEMFAVRPETVSRWERNEVAVPRTAAYALGQLYEHPKVTRQKLEAFERSAELSG